MNFTTDAILMASGFSKRFAGENKLLKLFKGKPLVWHTLSLVCGMNCFTKIWFVYHHQEVGEVAKEFPVQAVYNPQAALGACESIRLGVEASSAEQYLFLTCDQPLLTADVIAALLASAAPGAFVQPAYEGRPGNPVLFSAVYREELMRLAPRQRGRAVMERHQQNIITVPIASPWALEDADTPEKFALMQQIAEKG